ncbi:unnamed protein product, partial [Polarella glacialis]
DVRKQFFERIKEGTTWLQPEGRNGPIPRKTAWMVRKGCECKYRYGGIEVEPAEYPPWMIELMTSLMPLCGLQQTTHWPDSCNMNLYEDGGMSVGWHSDDEKIFQGKFRDIAIISLSLGVTRKFELRSNWPGEREKRVHQVLLGDGDLMTMEGMTQKHFQHRVPKEDNITGPRINLTWRWVGKHTPQCPACRARGSVNGPPPELTPVPSGRTPPPPAQPIESPVTSFKQDPQQTPILPSLGLEAPAVSSTAPEPGGLRAASCKAAPQMPPFPGMPAGGMMPQM